MTHSAKLTVSGVDRDQSISRENVAHGTHRRLRPSGYQQWLALNGRLMRSFFAQGGWIISVVAPLIFTLSFYLPLKFVMGVRGIDYAQFVMAIVVLQTMAFTMAASASLAAFEAKTGLKDRLQTMPVVSFVPLASRMTIRLIQATISLCAALGFGYAIGFRLDGGLGQSALFCGFALGVGIVFSLGADALGMLTASPEGVSQALTLPILIFGMLSCGFVPETGFPEWIRPFVRNQPISQFSYAMRDLADHGLTADIQWPAVIWLAGMTITLAPLAVWASVRRG